MVVALAWAEKVTADLVHLVPGGLEVEKDIDSRV